MTQDRPSRIDIAKVIAAFGTFAAEDPQPLTLQDIAREAGMDSMRAAQAMHAAADEGQLYRNRVKKNRWEFDLTVLPAARIICSLGNPDRPHWPKKKKKRLDLAARLERKTARIEASKKVPEFIRQHPERVRIFLPQSRGRGDGIFIDRARDAAAPEFIPTVIRRQSREPRPEAEPENNKVERVWIQSSSRGRRVYHRDKNRIVMN